MFEVSRVIKKVFHLRRIIQLLLLMSLVCCQSVLAEVSTSYDRRFDAEQQKWLSAKGTIVVGMPAADWAPYSYYAGNNRYVGLLHDYLMTISQRLGLKLRYQSYSSFANAQRAIQQGEVDLLAGVAVTPQRQARMRFTAPLIEIPRAVLLHEPSEQAPSLAQAAKMQWVCEEGFDSCDILENLGFKRIKRVPRNVEALVMVKHGLADAYLSDRPYLEDSVPSQRIQNAHLVDVPWVGPAELSLAIRAEDERLGELLDLAVDSLTPQDQNDIFRLAGLYSQKEKVRGEVLFTPEESAWIAEHPTVHFTPGNWFGLAQFDNQGNLTGLLAELLAMLERRSGLRFEMRHKDNRNDDFSLLAEGKVDMVPVAVNLPERREHLLFTPDYLTLKRLLVTGFNGAVLDSIDDVKGARIAGSLSVANEMSIRSWQAEPVLFSSFDAQLEALAEGKVDYMLINEGINEQILRNELGTGLKMAYSGEALHVPLAMAVTRENPMLASILSKTLRAIEPDEMELLQDKWFTLRIESGLTQDQWTRLIYVAVVVLVLIMVVATIGYLWNRSLSREVRQRQEAEKQLSRQLHLVEILLDTMPNLVAFTNERQEVELTNHAYRQLYLGGQDLRGPYAAILRGNVPENIVEHIKREESQVWESGDDINLQRFTTLHDGSQRELMCHKRQLRDQDGHRLGVLTVLTDVTELRQAQSRAEAATKARERFLATMSHELRTPIAGMHGMLELLQLGSLSEDQRYLVRNVVNSANGLLYLVNDILDYSKIRAGQLHLETKSVRLAEVVCAVVRSNVDSARHKGLQVNLVWDPALPDRAELDPNRLGQIATNLLHNAIKFTEQGAITLTLAYQESQLQLMVADTGIGIAQEQLPLLFTPFEQGENNISRRFGGTGLGLTISRGLAEQMGGSLILESEPGRGTRAILSLPLVRSNAEDCPLAGSHWQISESLPEAAALLRSYGAEVVMCGRYEPLKPGLLVLDAIDMGRLCPPGCQGGERRSDCQVLRGYRIIVLTEQEGLRTSLRTGSCLRLGSQPLYPDLLLESCLELLSQPAPHLVKAQHALRQLQGRVLVAEDHPINRALLGRQLTLLGVEFEMCVNGLLALQAWQNGGFDMLLTDCHMPEMDGYSLTATLRSQGMTGPIVGVTADVSEEVACQSREVGMTDLLHKPYHLEDLEMVLGKYLGPAVTSSQAIPQVNSTMSEHWLALFGCETTARALAAEYVQCNRIDLARLREAESNQAWDVLTKAAHSIKGAANMVGESELATLAAAIEIQGRQRQPDRLAELICQLHDKAAAVSNKIETWLDAEITN